MAKKRTWTIKVDGETFCNVIDYAIAMEIARVMLSHRKSVLVVDNSARKTVARFIYGHRQD